MSFTNSYQYEEYGQFFDCPDGDLAVKVLSAKETTAKSGARMLEVNLLVDGANNVPYVERYVEGEYFNRNMSRFFDAFGIPRGNFNYPTWVNKRAVGHFEHKQESYQSAGGEWKNVNRAVMKYLIVNDTNQSGPARGTQVNPADVEIIKILLDAKLPNGMHVFSENEKNRSRAEFANGRALSEIINELQKTLDARRAIPSVTPRDNAGADAAFNAPQEDLPIF